MSPKAAIPPVLKLEIDPSQAKDVGRDLEQTNAMLAERLRDVSVTDLPSLEQAVLDRQTIGDAIKSVQAYFKPLKELAFKMHRALCDRENAIVKPLQELDAAKSTAMSTFKAAQDRLRREEEQRQADEQRREREEQAARESAALEQQGDHAMAAAVMEEAIAAPAPVVALKDPLKSVAGFKTVRRYYWRLNPRYAHMVPREFLMVDELKLNAYARSMKGTGKVPGVDFYHVDEPIR